jgi:magnesium chelatase family protein
MLEMAVKQHALSARAHDRILKLARTRADLEGHDRIEDDDMGLAIDCRMIDRKSWLAGMRAARHRDAYFEKLLQAAQRRSTAEREDAS